MQRTSLDPDHISSVANPCDPSRAGDSSLILIQPARDDLRNHRLEIRNEAQEKKNRISQRHGPQIHEYISPGKANPMLCRFPRYIIHCTETIRRYFSREAYIIESDSGPLLHICRFYFGKVPDGACSADGDATTARRRQESRHETLF